MGSQPPKAKLFARSDNICVKKSCFYTLSSLSFSFPATHPVVICAVDVSGHAEVSDLDHQALAHQTVAGCQVTVDEVQRRQVDHA